MIITASSLLALSRNRLFLSEQLGKWQSDVVGELAEESEQDTEAKLPALDTNGVNEKVHQQPINNNVDQEDTKVTPLLTRNYVDGCKVAICHSVRAILA